MTTTKLREKTTTTCVRRRKKVKPCVLLPAFYVFSAFSLSGYFSCRSLWSKVKTCRLYELFLNFLPTFSPFQRHFIVLYVNLISPLKVISQEKIYIGKWSIFKDKNKEVKGFYFLTCLFDSLAKKHCQFNKLG